MGRGLRIVPKLLHSDILLALKSDTPICELRGCSNEPPLLKGQSEVRSIAAINDLNSACAIPSADMRSLRLRLGRRARRSPNSTRLWNRKPRTRGQEGDKNQSVGCIQSDSDNIKSRWLTHLYTGPCKALRCYNLGTMISATGFPRSAVEFLLSFPQTSTTNFRRPQVSHNLAAISDCG